MNAIEKMIQEYCSNGIEYFQLGSVVSILRGKRLTKSQLSDDEQYPVFHGGLEPLGNYSESNREGNTVMVINVGASAGTVGYSEVDFWSSDGCYCLSKSDILLSKYAYYVLVSQVNTLRSQVRVAGIPTLDASAVAKISIPIPPLPIQHEIVSILDKFTALEAALEAELEARKKQYEYYRNELLSFEGKEVEWKTLGECIISNKGGGTPSKAKAEFWNGHIPWASVGDLSGNGLFLYGTRNHITELGLKNSSTNLISTGDILVAVKIIPGKIKIANIDTAINQDIRGLVLKDFVLTKYLAYYFQTFNIVGNGAIVKSITSSTLEKINIPIPSITEQTRIVAILDNFDSLTNDISQGLPAEIEARRKQYEYYRGKLLTFKQL